LIRVVFSVLGPASRAGRRGPGRGERVAYTAAYGLIPVAVPLVPLAVIAAAFGFPIAAMLVPLLSEFDVALGRTTGEGT
jgi:hypothetical protein